MMQQHLDLGCGDKPRNPYNCDEVWGIDINFLNLSQRLRKLRDMISGRNSHLLWELEAVKRVGS